ncbi:MAG: pSer/pThr/pTyr-binding forkhead associated (FHA) protein [Myxococcota bacterium]|jgi:pSer/pThr/pTyr-binding forkhead associated (FHA) protein
MRPITCPSCNASVPPGYRFCGTCGFNMDEVSNRQEARETEFFEAAPVRRKARLVLLRGGGGDGASYYLNSNKHVCGRSRGMILFPDDPTVSPEHANFYYKDGRLYLKDMGSANGTFIRLRGRIPLEDGDRFIAGEQLFAFRHFPERVEDAWIGNTCYCGTPALWPWTYQVVQLLQGGRGGIVHSVETGNVTVGREDCDLSFPADRFMSHYHARVVQAKDVYYLEDTDSKNGTYYRVREEVGLQNGDYLFLGRQLMRVEIT